eukprot:ANDGO_02915.mRNA.1 Cell number regulator 10
MSGPYASPPPAQAQPNPYASAPVVASTVAPLSDYSSGLCSCLEDFELCCAGWCCNGCVTMMNKTALEQRPMEGLDWCLGCLLWAATGWIFTCPIHVFVVCKQREQMRQQFNFPQANDCLPSCCCLPCAICQNAREIKHRKAIGQLPVPIPKPL